ncbi:MAG: hypothetical protein QOC66_3296 [Pseudonocardiales bacterium]|nr:hypothetical protein [Pseudonocardiales bacterium]
MIDFRIGRRLVLPAVAGIAAATVGFGISAPAASGAPMTGSAAPAAMIRGGHFSPNTPGVDVYLTAFKGKTTKLWLAGVGYGDVSGYERFTPGLYAVSMRPHGAAASTPAALSWTLDARAGAAYTACAVGLNAQLNGIVLHDNLSPAPAGKARVRVIQAASRAKRADVVADGGPTLGRNVTFGTSTNYTTVAAGSYSLKATAVDNPTVHVSTQVALRPDTVDTVVVLDGRRGGITIRAIDDAAGAAVMPVGAVPGGGGGSAADARSSGAGGAGWAILAGLAAAAAIAVAAALRMRGQQSTRTP